MSVNWNAGGHGGIVYAKYNGACHYCEEELIVGVNTTLDHVIPKSQGGPSAVSNYVLSCESCNEAKTDKPYIEFKEVRSVCIRR